jgi:hypothetical protein
VNYRYPKGNSGFKTPTPQLMPTANLDFCLASESVPDTDLQVRHPHGSFCAAKVILFLNSTLKGSGFYRNFLINDLCVINFLQISVKRLFFRGLLDYELRAFFLYLGESKKPERSNFKSYFIKKNFGKNRYLLR